MWESECVHTLIPGDPKSDRDRLKPVSPHPGVGHDPGHRPAQAPTGSRGPPPGGIAVGDGDHVGLVVLAVLPTFIEPRLQRAGEHRVGRHAHFNEVGAQCAG